ncbi:MAG: YbjN domain-containing protein [Gemmatimonadota bacterium]|nr:MAG: YbjN domain-containing protein [Gemmatimonadota bacterium]
MEFETQAQQACYEKVAPWVTDLFGGSVLRKPDKPILGVMHGSAFAQVGVFPWGDNDAIITTRAYVVTGAELTAELMRFLLEENAGMRFGAFGVDDEGDIIFEHSIVGSTCDQKELESSVIHVARTADDYDDQIVARWGGERALDQIR